MALSLAACQETPDEVVVVKKDTERMIEQAGSEDNGNKLSELGIPDEHYTFNSELANGRLKINVDADIRVPRLIQHRSARRLWEYLPKKQSRESFNIYLKGYRLTILVKPV